MDPNVTLKRILHIAAEIREGQATMLQIENLGWEIADLDTWLRAGGGLPRVWKPGELAKASGG